MDITMFSTHPPSDSGSIAQDALHDEARLLVNTAGARVEREHSERDPVQAQPLEAIADDQAGGLRAEATIPALGRQQDPEVAAAVAGVPLIEHNLADAGARGLVDDRQVEPVPLLMTSAVPGKEPVLGFVVPGSEQQGCQSDGPPPDPA